TSGPSCSLYPFGRVREAEDRSIGYYGSRGRFEKGRSKGHRTRTGSLSWEDKSWVIGIDIGGKAKAYDWIELKQSGILHDEVGNTPVIIAIASDEQSFAVFKRKSDEEFILRNDSLISNSVIAYDFAGRGASG